MCAGRRKDALVCCATQECGWLLSDVSPTAVKRQWDMQAAGEAGRWAARGRRKSCRLDAPRRGLRLVWATPGATTAILRTGAVSGRRLRGARRTAMALACHGGGSVGRQRCGSLKQASQQAQQCVSASAAVPARLQRRSPVSSLRVYCTVLYCTVLLGGSGAAGSSSAAVSANVHYSMQLRGEVAAANQLASILSPIGVNQ